MGGRQNIAPNKEKAPKRGIDLKGPIGYNLYKAVSCGG